MPACSPVTKISLKQHLYVKKPFFVVTGIQHGQRFIVLKFFKSRVTTLSDLNTDKGFKVSRNVLVRVRAKH